jgi:ubiquitin C
MPVVPKMQIFVKTLSGKTIAVDVEGSEYVEDLMERVHSKEGIPMDEQRLVHNGRQIYHGTALSDCGIHKESIIHLKVRCFGGMQIFVKTLSGQTITLEVESTDTIEKVKDMLIGRKGIPPDQQRLG